MLELTSANDSPFLAPSDSVSISDRSAYSAVASALLADLSPEGAIEEILAAEIITAAWRLRRCRNSEMKITAASDLDPMENPAVDKIQKSVDRARADALDTIRRCTAELRKLQTERATRRESCLEGDGWGLADTGKVIRAVSRGHQELIKEKKQQDRDRSREFRAAVERDLMAPLPSLLTPPAAPEAATAAAPLPAPKPPRNSSCPCGSTLKYKKCCGSAAVHNSKYAATRAA
jgi:hypothetical protein